MVDITYYLCIDLFFILFLKKKQQYFIDPSLGLCLWATSKNVRLYSHDIMCQ